MAHKPFNATGSLDETLFVLFSFRLIDFSPSIVHLVVVMCGAHRVYLISGTCMLVDMFHCALIRLSYHICFMRSNDSNWAGYVDFSPCFCQHLIQRNLMMHLFFFAYLEWLQLIEQIFTQCIDFMPRNWHRRNVVELLNKHSNSHRRSKIQIESQKS